MTRWTARLGLAGLTAIAAWVSYSHALIVVQAADGHSQASFFVPLLADLLIATATANIIDASRHDGRWPRLSVVSICVGVVVTLGMNVASGSPQDVPAWLVNAWPPVAFVLALESFAGHIRRGRRVRSGDTSKDSSATQDHAEPLSTEAALAALLASDSQRQLARFLGIDRSRVQTWARRSAEVAEPAAPAVAYSNGDGHV